MAQKRKRDSDKQSKCINETIQGVSRNKLDGVNALGCDKKRLLRLLKGLLSYHLSLGNEVLTLFDHLLDGEKICIQDIESEQIRVMIRDLLVVLNAQKSIDNEDVYSFSEQQRTLDDLKSGFRIMVHLAAKQSGIKWQTLRAATADVAMVENEYEERPREALIDIYRRDYAGNMDRSQTSSQLMSNEPWGLSSCAQNKSPHHEKAEPWHRFNRDEILKPQLRHVKPSEVANLV